jgi:hypothetical protein
MNKEIGIIIRCFIENITHNEWVKILPRDMFDIRTAQHAKMKSSSIHLILNYNPRAPWDFFLNTRKPIAIKETSNRMEKQCKRTPLETRSNIATSKRQSDRSSGKERDQLQC